MRENESPGSTGSANSFKSGEERVLPLLSEIEQIDIQACAISETATPLHVLQTVMLLKTPPVQDVVESIVCDKNVRNAVSQNKALQEFFLSQKTSAPSLIADSNAKDSVENDKFTDQKSPKNSEDSSVESQLGNIGTGFMEMLQHIKLSVVDMASNFPGFIQNIIRTPVGGNVSVNVTDKDTNNLSILGASVMGLAALVIVMAVLKKN